LVVAIGFSYKLKGKDDKDSSDLLDDDIEIIRSDDKHDFELTDDDSMRKTVLYFKDKYGFLVPVMTKLPWKRDS